MNKNLVIKIKESLSSVLPIVVIVLLLHFFVTPMSSGMLGLFIVGAVMLILGMGLFTLGADMAMMPMGEQVGSQITKSKRVWLLVLLCFFLGAFITIAEPDLTVLANQLTSVPNMVIILTVAAGVGIFLVVGVWRILRNLDLSRLLMVLYIGVFILALFVPEDFLAVAFDSGGVTTGPITVPFIMALGIGLASVKGGKSAQEDSFGTVALCSIGPIVAMMLLGIFYQSDGGTYSPLTSYDVNSFGEIMGAYGHNLLEQMLDVAIALLPIILFFGIFQVIFLKLPKKNLRKLGVGLIYTYVGLVLFLTGANVGFLPVGQYLGGALASLSNPWWLIPIGMVMGFFVVMAEPAVHVLNKQVEDITVGAISKRAMLMSLSIGVAISVGISMLRVITGVSIWYFLLGGYAIALVLSLFVPKIFTAIAFDSGGVASGPMTATFMLPFAMGACEALGGNIMQDAFGLVAMVAMTPLITIQALGLVYSIKLKRAEAMDEQSEDDIDEIIELPIPALETEAAEIEIIEFDWEVPV